MYLAKAKRYLDQINLIPPQHIYPCTPAEIATLEATIGLRLPEAFREFLLWCGKGLGDFGRGSNFYYQMLIQNDTLEYARELLAENSLDPSLLHDQDVIFWMHQGYLFAYIPTDQGDDPPVYGYSEGDEGIKKQYAHFSEYLYTVIEQHNQYSGLVSVYNLKHLYDPPIFDDRVTSLHFNGDIKLPSVPDRVFDFRNLETLDLRYIGLVTLSARIGELGHLRWLYLNGNALTNLPAELAALSKLERLYLNDNQLTAALDLLKDLPQLKYLSLTGNPLDLAEVKQLRRAYPDLVVYF